MDFKELLNKAYEFEQKGEQIYTEIANNTKNPVTKTVFEYLAQQENKHAYEISKYIKENQIESLGDDAATTQKFFNKTVKQFKEELKGSEDDKEAYEKAMGLEQDSYDYYKEVLENSEDEKMNHFLKFLMEQENAHYELIQKTYEFTKDPKAFFDSQEDAFFEG